ncbi:MAG TPA: PilN domain-containing protein [Roseiarcus sp.]|nr:PilN domain-containing protein [Roseiarcus sp.]
MTAAVSMVKALERWIDDVTAGFARAGAMIRRGRTIELVEQPDGSFLALVRRNGETRPLNEPSLRVSEDGFAGPTTGRLRSLISKSRVDVELAPSRFLFRTLELPLGADQFLEGVVRSQIDRLTPWSADAAAFGWSAPRAVGPDRIAVTVAATARELVAPIAKSLIAEHAEGFRLSTRSEDGGAIIPVLTERTGGGGDAGLRKGVMIGLAAALLVFLVSLAAWLILGNLNESRDRALQAEMARRRAELLHNAGSADQQAIQAIEQRKRTTPSAVIALEELSKALPDDAHLTELRIEDGKIDIIGLARDASALIPLIEQSRQFTQATFVGPTVRAPNGGEIFHIEAHLEPSFASRS